MLPGYEGRHRRYEEGRRHDPTQRDAKRPPRGLEDQRGRFGVDMRRGLRASAQKVTAALDLARDVGPMTTLPLLGGVVSRSRELWSTRGEADIAAPTGG